MSQEDKSPQEIRKDMEDAIQMSRANSETYETLVMETSKLYWMRFRSLVAAGFSEQQALAIILSRGME